MNYIKKIFFENIKNKVIIGVKFQSIKNFFDRKAQINLLFKAVLILATAVVGTFSLSEYLMDFITISQNGIEFQYVLRAFSVVSILILAAFLSVNFEGIFFKKLSISYLVYLLISYFLLITQNLNNEHFKFFAFDTNNFFEVRSIGLIFIIVLVAFLLKYSATKIELIDKYTGYLRYNRSSDTLLLSLVAIIVLQDSKLVEKLKQFLSLSDYSNYQQLYLQIFYFLITSILIVSLVTILFWQSINKLKKNQSSLSLAVISSLFFAVVFNFMIQFGIRMNEDFYGEYIFLGATAFQLILFSLFNFTVYILINRYWQPTLLIVFLGTTITIANGLKYSMRREPLLLTDFSMLTQLDLIFNYIDLKILSIGIFLIIILIFSNFFLKNRYLKGKIISNLKTQIFILFVSFTFFLSIFSVFFNQENGRISNNIPILSRLNNSYNISFTGHATTARFQSLSYVWMKQLTRPIMDKPDNYNKETIQALVEKYKKRATEINVARTQLIEEETVIFILSESFADPARIDGVTLSQDVLTNFKGIAAQTTSGLMKSDAYGGGTANIEIQTLLGLPYYNLSSSISIYNTEVVPKMKTLPSISNFYESQNRYVIHLGETKLYSRGEVYRKLGFDSFIANDKLSMSPTESINYGGFPSDGSTYQNILDKLDLNQNQFFSVITYQNHVPWSMSEPADITGSGDGFSTDENNQLSNFSRLLYETDNVTKDFLDKLSTMDKKITVVFYGDHLPGLYPESIFENNSESKYLTDYFIWSNKGNQKLNFPLVNSSDFPAALLAHTNSKVSPYYALLTDVLYNSSVDKTELSEAAQIIADDLKLIQYDITVGKNYLKNYNEFFNIEN
ncbi:TPA: sulfatase-like hydrolase/transferase [Streptococcus suis]|nr:sulfatase-like hydrolase/transferase [Streptococcus suis]